MPNRLLMLAGAVGLAWLLLNEFAPNGQKYVSRFITKNVKNPEIKLFGG